MLFCKIFTEILMIECLLRRSIKRNRLKTMCLAFVGIYSQKKRLHLITNEDVIVKIGDKSLAPFSGRVAIASAWKGAEFTRSRAYPASNVSIFPTKRDAKERFK